MLFRSRRHQPLRRLYVRVGGRIIPVAVEKILHCEARGDYVALHTAEGCYVVNTSVEYLAERLSPESFVRIRLQDVVVRVGTHTTNPSNVILISVFHLMHRWQTAEFARSHQRAVLASQSESSGWSSPGPLLNKRPNSAAG